MIFDSELSTNPIQIEYREVEARKILTGQISLKEKFAYGMLNEITMKEGQILAENIRVVFPPYQDELIFRSSDNLLIEGLIEIIRIKYDKLTSTNSCIKPIYSRPKGFISSSGTGSDELFVYELRDIALGGSGIALPYFLYMRSPNGSTMNTALQVLARRIRVHIGDNLYTEFRPGNITVSEVIALCRRRFEEHKKKLSELGWGIYSQEPVQESRGRFQRTPDGINFKLLDLLDKKSYLPVIKTPSGFELSVDIIISTAIDDSSFNKGTPLKEIWNIWPVGDDSYVNDLQGHEELCLLTSAETLPSRMGLVLNKRVIICWSEDIFTTFDINTPILYIKNKLARLNRQNSGDPTVEFTGPSFKKYKPNIILDDSIDIFDKAGDTKQLLIRFGRDVLPLYVHYGLDDIKAKTVYEEYKNDIIRQRHFNRERVKIWVRDAKRHKKGHKTANN